MNTQFVKLAQIRLIGILYPVIEDQENTLVFQLPVQNCEIVLHTIVTFYPRQWRIQTAMGRWARVPFLTAGLFLGCSFVFFLFLLFPQKLRDGMMVWWYVRCIVLRVATKGLGSAMLSVTYYYDRAVCVRSIALRVAGMDLSSDKVTFAFITIIFISCFLWCDVGSPQLVFTSVLVFRLSNF